MEGPEFNDDDISSEVIESSSVPSYAVDDPSILYGGDQWNRMLDSDLANDGMNARAQFDYDWDFSLTPGQRARALWNRRTQNDATELFDELYASLDAAAGEVSKSELDSVLRRRNGGTV